MKYPKDPYYLNTELVNKKASQQEIHNKGFYELATLLQKNKENNIYEVGFDFGQRLLYLQENDISIFGGVEFDPIFGLYKKHANLFENGWDTRFTQIDYWGPINRSVVITNNFLDLFKSEDVPVLLEKLLKTSDKLYMNENLELDLPKIGNVYVVINQRRDDITKPTKASKIQKIELPSIKPSTDGVDGEESVIKDPIRKKT